MMTKAEQIIKNAKQRILEQIKDKLQEAENSEVYFHDIISSEIDALTPTDRKTCIDLIDLSDSKFFDEGLIDHSSLDRTLITSAYCSIEQNLFNDNFIQDLQEKLNNEKISKEEAKNIISNINAELNKMGIKLGSIYEDNSTQIFLNTSFSLGSITKEEFLKYGLLDAQVLDLSDSFKILTSNKSLNQNAIVIEEKKRNIEEHKYIFRIYLMEKLKEIEIRDLFKLENISEDTGFNLSPSAYIEQTTKQYEEDKFYNRKNYLTSFKDKTQFIKHIVRMANKLTMFSMDGKEDKKSNIKIVKSI